MLKEFIINFSLKKTKASISEEKARQYHSKLQLFILWFIDGSSFIDDTDTNWDLFFL